MNPTRLPAPHTDTNMRGQGWGERRIEVEEYQEWKRKKNESGNE